MKDKKKTVVEYEVEFVLRVKDSVEFSRREETFAETCPHPSTIARWVLEDIEEDLEDKKYKVVSFNKISFRNVNKVKEQ